MIFQLPCRDNMGSLPPMRLSLTVPSSQNVICCNEYRCNVSKKVKQAALDAERRQAMSHSISTLLTRNLHDVFGENDPARRRAAIDEIFTEDCVFYEPNGVYRGRDEIDRVAGAVKATHATFDISQLPGPKNWAMGADPMGIGPP